MSALMWIAQGVKVYDASQEPRLEIERVLAVDPWRGRVEVLPRRDPGRISVRRLDDRDDLIEFERIDTETDADMKITAFHCYGRQP